MYNQCNSFFTIDSEDSSSDFEEDRPVNKQQKQNTSLERGLTGREDNRGVCVCVHS